MERPLQLVPDSPRKRTRHEQLLDDISELRVVIWRRLNELEALAASLAANPDKIA